MSLNSIKFETTDIALLFKNSLVEVDEKKQDLPVPRDTTSVVSSQWNSLGENKKRTLVVVRSADAAVLPDKHLSFLTKLLAACNMQLADVAIVNLRDHQPSQFNEVIDHFKPKTVLLFDTKPPEFGLPMNFPDFQVQAYKEMLFVSSPSLQAIEPDKNLKGKLWTCLKKIYNL